MSTQRKKIDCGAMPNSTCSLVISGTEAEVLPVAVRHAIDAHGYEDTPDLPDKLRAALVDA